MPKYAKEKATLPRPELQGRDLYDLIEDLSGGHLERPLHMAAMVDKLQGLRSRSRPARRERKGRVIVIDAPVQHGKSTIEQHFMVGCLLDDPQYKIAFCGYGQDFVKPQSKITREIARTAGIQFKDDNDTIGQWGTPDGGFCMFTTVGGALTGFGFDLILIDDPFKSREEVERFEERENIWVWYTQTVLPRLAPWTDIVIIASRWHVDDLSGRLLRMGVEHVHIKAIQDDGTALWEHVRPIAFLLEQRKNMGEYAFAGNFQGEPYIDGDASFNEPARYHTVPERAGFKYVIGFDLAFSQSRKADHFAMCVIKVWGSEVFVIEIRRLKAELQILADLLKETSRKYGNCPCVSYMSGPEEAGLLYLARAGVRVAKLPAKSNKRFRAQRTLDEWRRGRVVWPFAGYEESLGRIRAFRGNEGDQDDEVDALVSAIDFALGSGTVLPRVPGGHKAYAGFLG